MNEKARWLTAANVVSFVRLLLTVPIVYALLQEGSLWRWAGLILLLVAAASDGLDGYLARSRGEISPLGQLLDPIADKVLSIALLAVLLHQALLPPWMFWALFVKEALLLLGGAVLLRRGLARPQCAHLGQGRDGGPLHRLLDGDRRSFPRPLGLRYRRDPLACGGPRLRPGSPSPLEHGRW